MEKLKPFGLLKEGAPESPTRLPKIVQTFSAAILSIMAAGSMSGCSNTPETEANTTNEDDEWEREYDICQREHEIYLRQLKREVEERMTSAKEENSGLTEIELKHLEMQFESEIRIAASNRRLETRLALLKRSWVKPELQDLAKLTEEKMAEVREHIGNNGNVRLVAIPHTEHEMLYTDDLSPESLHIEIIMALLTSGEVTSIAGDYQCWALAKKISEDSHTQRIMQDLHNLREQWKNYTDSDPTIQDMRIALRSAGVLSPANLGASLETR